MIDRIDLTNASPKEALRALANATVKADPERRGVSFVGHFLPQDLSAKITVHLENVSVKEALKHLFPYQVEDSVVSVGYDHICESVIIRKFYLPDGLFLIGPSEPGQVQMRTFDVKKQLAAKGVSFPPGATVFYQADKQELTVMAISSDMINPIDEIVHP